MYYIYECIIGATSPASNSKLRQTHMYSKSKQGRNRFPRMLPFSTLQLRVFHLDMTLKTRLGTQVPRPASRERGAHPTKQLTTCMPSLPFKPHPKGCHDMPLDSPHLQHAVGVWSVQQGVHSQRLTLRDAHDRLRVHHSHPPACQPHPTNRAARETERESIR